MEIFARSEESVESLASFSLLGSSAIWGIGISQTFQYFVNLADEPADAPRHLTHLVVWLCLADSIRQAFTIYSSITLYFSTQALFPSGSGIWLPGLVMPYLASALVACSTQAFFTYRIWVLSEKKIIIPIVAAPAILFQLCFPPILFDSIKSNVVSQTTQTRFLIATLVVGAVVDISIAMGLSGLLWRHYVGDAVLLKSTKIMIQRMMLFSINTGMWTALVALGTVIIFFRMPSDWRFFAYFHLLSPLYYTTVLANLNARSYVRKMPDPSLPSGVGTIDSLVFAPGNPRSANELPVASESNHKIRRRQGSMTSDGYE